MEYLQELADRTWRIAWSCLPLALAAALCLARGRLRPVNAHALALGTGLAFVVPLLVPVHRHVFELPPGVRAASETAIHGALPVPWWTVMSVSFVLLAAHALCGRGFRRRLDALAAAPPDVQRRIARLAKELGLSRLPRASICDDDTGPLVVWGVRRHRLLLPRAHWARWDEEQRDVVLLHELAHLRRHDGPARALWAFVTLVYWWNPLVWYLRRVSNDAAELACDRWATELRGASRTRYARLLLALAAERPHGCRGPGLQVFAAEKRRLGRRLQSILGDTRTPTSAWPALVLVAVLAIGTALTAGQVGAIETRHVLATRELFESFLCGETSAGARRRAVDALGNRGRAGAAWALPLLARRFEAEPSASVRYEILDAVARLRTDEAIDGLLASANADSSARVRRRGRELAGAQR